MENSVYFITLAAGLLLTGLFITLSVVLFRETDGATDRVISKSQGEIVALSELEYTMIQTQALSGMNVKTYIQQYQDVLLMQVVTKRVASGFYEFDSMNVKESKYYINDKATFSGKVVRDADGDIAALSFTEVGAVEQPVDLTYAKSEALDKYNAMDSTYYDNLADVNSALSQAENDYRSAELKYSNAQRVLVLKKAELDSLPLGDLNSKIDEVTRKISSKSADLETLKRIMSEKGIEY